jgi:hypothetical protein
MFKQLRGFEEGFAFAAVEHHGQLFGAFDRGQGDTAFGQANEPEIEPQPIDAVLESGTGGARGQSGKPSQVILNLFLEQLFGQTIEMQGEMRYLPAIIEQGAFTAIREGYFLGELLIGFFEAHNLLDRLINEGVSGFFSSC